MTKKNFGRNDLFLILGIFAAAVLMLVAYSRYMSHADTPMLEITVDNRLFGTYDLKHDARIRINNTNVCEIKDGAVRMLSANCPDQICVYIGQISTVEEVIACLPHGMIVYIEEEGSSYFECFIQYLLCEVFENEELPGHYVVRNFFDEELKLLVLLKDKYDNIEEELGEVFLPDFV